MGLGWTAVAEEAYTTHVSGGGGAVVAVRKRHTVAGRVAVPAAAFGRFAGSVVQNGSGIAFVSLYLPTGQAFSEAYWEVFQPLALDHRSRLAGAARGSREVRLARGAGRLRGLRGRPDVRGA